MISAICLHAFTVDAETGDESYCDPNDETPNGWCVYVRKETPGDPSQPFDVIAERDFIVGDHDSAEQAARDQAEQWATLYSVPVQEY